MSRTGVSCRVLLDGRLLDDGCIDWGNPPAGDIVGYGVSAADGLQIQWGRGTTVDQPQPSTCTFTVVDDPGGASVLDALELGMRVDVFADADIGADDDAPTDEIPFEDPDFNVEVRVTATNATVRRVSTGEGFGASWIRRNLDGTAKLVFPPGEIQAPGTNPAAWAELATTAGGQTWTVRAHIVVPPGLTVDFAPVLYSGPWDAAATILTAETVRTTTPGPQTLEISFTPGTAAAWVGLYLASAGGATWGTIDPALTWGTVDAGSTWDTYERVTVEAFEVIAPTGQTGTSVLAFSGRITDLAGLFDESWGAPVMKVTVSDYLADLANRYIGAEPWPAETVIDRVSRIVTAAQLAGEQVQVQVDDGVQDVLISYQDVDNQATAGLLTDVSQSVDAVLWSSVHPVIGPYLRIEDTAARTALYALALVDDLIVVVPATSGEDGAPTLSACDVLRDPVEFVKDVADLTTRVSVRWLEQITNEEGEPDTAEHTVSFVDEAGERQFGSRSVSLSTLLALEDDATRVAEQLHGRLDASWRVTGLEVSDAAIETPDRAAAVLLMTLLNGVTRGGQPLILTDLDAWSPVGSSAPIYLEGGTYQYVDGGWNLQLDVSRAAGLGASAKWNEIPNDPAWIWDAWDPALTWDSLRGVKGPGVNLATNGDFEETTGSTVIVRWNLFPNPRGADPASSGWAVGTGTGATPAQNPDADGVTYTNSETTVRVGPYVNLAIETTYTVRLTVTTTARISPDIVYRPFSPSSMTGQALLFDDVVIEANTPTELIQTFTTTTSAPNASSLPGVYVVETNVPVGSTITITEPIIEQAPQVGPYLDGARSTDTDLHPAWSGTVDASASGGRGDLLADLTYSAAQAQPYQHRGTDVVAGAACVRYRLETNSSIGLSVLDFSPTAGVVYRLRMSVRPVNRDLVATPRIRDARGEETTYRAGVWTAVDLTIAAGTGPASSTGLRIDYTNGGHVIGDLVDIDAVTLEEV